MPTSREQLLEQLRKLRRLAADVAGTPEAAAATRKVRELMKRYGVTADDLKPTSAPHIHHEVRPPTRRAPSTSSVTKPAPPASTPVVITIKLGDLRIRWKL